MLVRRERGGVILTGVGLAGVRPGQLFTRRFSPGLMWDGRLDPDRENPLISLSFLRWSGAACGDGLVDKLCITSCCPVVALWYR